MLPFFCYIFAQIIHKDIWSQIQDFNGTPFWAKCVNFGVLYLANDHIFLEFKYPHLILVVIHYLLSYLMLFKNE